MKIRFLVSCLFILLLSNNSFAKPACENLYNDLKVNFDEYGADVVPRYKYNDFGFNVRMRFNAETDKWEFDKNKDGYLKVGKITDSNLIGKISPNDLIMSANGKDLRNENLSRRENKYIQDLFDNGEKVNFKFKNLKEYDLTLTKVEYERGEPFIDFWIKSIEIDEKKNKINARIKKHFQYLWEEDKEDSSNNKLYQGVLKNLKSETPLENGDYYAQHCEYTPAEWLTLRAVNPAQGLDFLNLHSIDQDLLQTRIEVNVYSDQFPRDVKQGWANDLTIDWIQEGVFTFNTDFDLRNFPFDKQTISFFLINRTWSMNENLTTISDFAQKELMNYAKLNKITGWDIVNNSLKYDTYKGPNDIFYFDGIKVELEIERKQDYYLYKIIFPIMLILLVCWSAVWITPKEIESRLTITIVCLLSLIAYNFVIDSELPRLEYLTIMDYIILISYVYATIPNFLSVISFNLITTNKSLGRKVERYGKRYGILSYILIVFFIIIINTTKNPEHTASMLSWMIPK
jgi:hypothetical protein